MTGLPRAVPPDGRAAGRRTRVRRPVAWAALGLALVWPVSALVNWSTGGFWWWGGAVPLLVFCAGPLLVLATVPLLLLSRTRLSRPERVLVSLATAQVALVVLRRLLTGRTWVWVVPDLMVPPLLFALLPAALLAAVALLAVCRVQLGRAARRWTVLLAATALVLGLDGSGLNPRAPWAWVGAAEPVPPGALHVVSWDTYCWDTTDDPGRFLAYLKRFRADVYLLQEYSGCGPGAPLPIHDGDLLRRAFPGHHVVTADGLLTISRLPVADRAVLGTRPNPLAPSWRHAALRTDVSVGGRLVSLYNVHLYDMLYLSSSPLSREFYRSIAVLDAERGVQLDELAADIGRNPHPLLVSGNLNALPGTGHAGRLGHLSDAARAGRSPYPATLTFAGLRLWRMDWTLTSYDMRVHRYDLRSPEGLSTHHLQETVVSPADVRGAPPPHPAPDRHRRQSQKAG
ncbi:endonuclease/exonuclease/phosphatase family protein [Streptosporangium sp. DT93]|uniref:endonuclease/exonuclease/phosphatase family protein n=1 Tax=Streptosporangium sp. DT93 TaxID=3393428 RepID=UPI003CEFC2A4